MVWCLNAAASWCNSSNWVSKLLLQSTQVSIIKSYNLKWKVQLCRQSKKSELFVHQAQAGWHMTKALTCRELHVYNQKSVLLNYMLGDSSLGSHHRTPQRECGWTIIRVVVQWRWKQIISTIKQSKLCMAGDQQSIRLSGVSTEASQVWALWAYRSNCLVDNESHQQCNKRS